MLMYANDNMTYNRNIFQFLFSYLEKYVYTNRTNDANRFSSKKYTFIPYKKLFGCCINEKTIGVMKIIVITLKYDIKYIFACFVAKKLLSEVILFFSLLIIFFYNNLIFVDFIH